MIPGTGWQADFTHTTTRKDGTEHKHWSHEPVVYFGAPTEEAG